MGRSPCCDKMGVKRGPWSAQEDQILVQFIRKNGHRNWRALPKQAGLLRCGKSCRLRWVNYLRPDVKRGKFSAEEEETVIKLHNLLGNRWSAIASQLPGRTDNEIKNVWNTHLKKRLLKGGSDPTKCSNSSMEENSSISSSPDSQHTSSQMFSNMNSIGSESSTVDSASTLDWLQYDAANSTGYGEFKDLVIDETFVIQNQTFQDGERDFGSSTTTSDVFCEDNSNIKVEYFNSGYVEDDLMSCLDSKTTNLHLLWNTELESDEEDYWLNVLSQLGSPPIL